MKVKYIGEENWVYYNLVPQIDIELKNGEEYDVNIQSDAPTIIVNGVPMQQEPTMYQVVFNNGAWIPYAAHRLKAHWDVK